MTALVLALFLAFFLAQLAVETGLAVANLRHVARAGDAVPPPLLGQVDAETARKSHAYTLARGRYGLAHGCYGVLPRGARALVPVRRRLHVLLRAARELRLAQARIRGRPLLGRHRSRPDRAPLGAGEAERTEPVQPPSTPLVQRVALLASDAGGETGGHRARRSGDVREPNVMSLPGARSESVDAVDGVDEQSAAVQLTHRLDAPVLERL